MLTFQFTESEQKYLEIIRAFAVDPLGRTVLVGLTYEESVKYMRIGRSRLISQTSKKRFKEYCALRRRHESARLAIQGVDAFLALEKRARVLH